MVEDRAVKLHTITIQRIEEIKVHPRETINDVVTRLLDAHQQKKG